jgi:putative phosphoesterase
MREIRLGVLSDTHVSSMADLPAEIVEGLRHVDRILHAGDYTGMKLVDDLRLLGDFRGVCGNMDPLAVRGVLPEKDVVEVNGRRLGLVHGWGAPLGLQRRALGCFSDVDAVIYGHSHMAKSEDVDGVLLFNPGSATGRFPALGKTYGILTIGNAIRGEIVAVG